MLPKKQRVDKKSIEEVFSKGRFVNSAYLSLKYLQGKSIGAYKISFVAPKAVAKKAVDRNLLKRRGYYVLKNLLSKPKSLQNKSFTEKEGIFFLPNGFVGVFVFKKNSLNVFGCTKNKQKNPIKNLENELLSVLDRIRS
ncbi:MAG: ribonuclease P protein component [Candidatus Pacebacteria bacterium]|nr:ribonuclease P protein component [Candidatus Paceibacterota bacterium]MCF7862406.1 ribonuclease P protein component [Candidatus Paceibacterota bacterium]